MPDAPTAMFESTRDRVTQLRRLWAAEQPRAALLLVHGIGEHSGRYEHVGSFLAERGIDTLAFDNRGFGQSGGRRAHIDSFDQYLDDIEDLMKERRRLGVPVVLMGHSLGGLMVGAYVTSGRPAPDLVILSAPALAAEVPRWQRLLAPILGRVLPRMFVPSKIDGELLSRDVEVQQAYVNDPLVVAGATAGMGHQVFQAMAATSEKLTLLSVPTYVLHGEADALVPPSASAPLAERPSVERRTWPNLRHECLNEPEQDEVLAALMTWLDGQLASRSAQLSD